MNKAVVGKIFVIVIFIGGIALWLFYPRRLPPPQEANRIMHPDGYSFIRPPGWVTNYITAEATINSLNRGWLRAEPPNRGHDPTALVVNVLSKPPIPPPPGFHPGTFQGHPAEFFSDKFQGSWAFRIQFQDHGWWFEIDLSSPYKIDQSNSEWWPYINSFRFEPEKASKHATTKTTMPVFVFPTTSFATTQPSPSK